MMPLDDPSDPSAETRRLKKRVERIEAGTAGGDSTHPGTGSNSVQLGPDDASASGTNAVAIGRAADASGYDSVAVGRVAQATGSDFATAVGAFSYADAENATALGASTSVEGVDGTAVGFHTIIPFGMSHSTALGADAQPTKSNQVRLGDSTDEVSVAGRLNVTTRTPSSSADTQGTTRDIAWDDNYIYVKTSAGWKRSALSAF
jgi:hypothetical protein